MKVYPVVTYARLALAAVLLLQSEAAGQWLKQPAAGLPRTSDGKPNLAAAAPRGVDGKPDLSGLWQPGAKYESDFKAVRRAAMGTSQGTRARGEPCR